MDFNQIIAEFFSSVLIVFRRSIMLIFSPYRAMRRISLETDYLQLGTIFLVVYVYFKFVYYLKDKPLPATIIFFIFLINFFLTVNFFYLICRIFNRQVEFSSFFFTFSYSLLPTLIWFFSVSLFYIILPPPRTLSLMGRGFSVFFIAYSLSLLVWKLILVYLSLRFSTKLGFYRIIYLIILYLTWFLPYSMLLYQLKIFRVPFI